MLPCTVPYLDMFKPVQDSHVALKGAMLSCISLLGGINLFRTKQTISEWFRNFILSVEIAQCKQTLKNQYFKKSRNIFNKNAFQSKAYHPHNTQITNRLQFIVKVCSYSDTIHRRFGLSLC